MRQEQTELCAGRTWRVECRVQAGSRRTANGGQHYVAQGEQAVALHLDRFLVEYGRHVSKRRLQFELWLPVGNPRAELLASGLRQERAASREFVQLGFDPGNVVPRQPLLLNLVANRLRKSLVQRLASRRRAAGVHPVQLGDQLVRSLQLSLVPGTDAQDAVKFTL